MWESNPPPACLEPDTGFEVREARRVPRRFRVCKCALVQPDQSTTGGHRHSAVTRTDPHWRGASGERRKRTDDILGPELKVVVRIMAVDEHDPRHVVRNPESAQQRRYGRVRRNLDGDPAVGTDRWQVPPERCEKLDFDVQKEASFSARSPAARQTGGSP